MSDTHKLDALMDAAAKRNQDTWGAADQLNAAYQTVRELTELALILERENAVLDKKNAALSTMNLELCASLKEAHGEMGFEKEHSALLWRRIDRLSKVLRRIASTAGDPDPVQACRHIIQLVKESGEI